MLTLLLPALAEESVSALSISRPDSSFEARTTTVHQAPGTEASPRGHKDAEEGAEDAAGLIGMSQRGGERCR